MFSLGGQDNYAFSPDGTEICYTSNHDKNEAASTNNDLWIAPVNGAADASSAGSVAKNITADNPASDSTPLYSPDGRYIAYRAQQRPGYESDRFRLMVYDRKTGEKKDLTDGFEQWVGTFIWTPDSKTIDFSSDHEGHSLVYALDVANAGTSRRTIVGGYNDDLALTPDGKTLLFTRMSIAAPTEIYAADPAGPGCPARNGDVDAGKESCALNKDWAVTHVNDSLLLQVSMSKIESFSFKGAHGDEVEGFLVKPPNFDASKKYPVKFLIHGGPEGAWGDDWSYRWNPELFASPTSGSSNSTTSSGYVVIMINFHGSTGYGQKFIDAINGDWGGAPFEDLMKGLDYAEQTYPFIDKNRECALGASYGGYMINWIARPHRPLQVSRVARRNVQHVFGLGYNGGNLVQQLGVRRHSLHGTRHIQQVVATQFGSEFQDADAGGPRAARLPARRERRLPAFHYPANDGRPVEDALLPRRRPLGAEAAEFRSSGTRRSTIG